jgi:WD40 repeat protein
LVSDTKVATLIGHAEGATCVDLSPDQMKFWTGGLDNTVRSWDIRANTELNKYQLDSQAKIISHKIKL